MDCFGRLFRCCMYFYAMHICQKHVDCGAFCRWRLLHPSHFTVESLVFGPSTIFIYYQPFLWFMQYPHWEHDHDAFNCGFFVNIFISRISPKVQPTVINNIKKSGSDISYWVNSSQSDITNSTTCNNLNSLILKSTT